MDKITEHLYAACKDTLQAFNNFEDGLNARGIYVEQDTIDFIRNTLENSIEQYKQEAQSKVMQTEQLAAQTLNTIETTTLIPINEQQFLIAVEGQIIGYYIQEKQKAVFLSSVPVTTIAKVTEELRLINQEVYITVIVGRLDLALVRWNCCEDRFVSA